MASSNQQLSRPQAVAESGAAHLETALAALCQLRQRRNRLFIISDLAGSLQLWREALHRLARHHHVQVLHITDPLEAELPPTGVYNISQGDESLSFYSGDKTLRKRYADTHAERAADIKKYAGIGSFASGVEHRKYPLGSSELGLMYDACPTKRLPD